MQHTLKLFSSPPPAFDVDILTFSLSEGSLMFVLSLAEIKKITHGEHEIYCYAV